LNSLPPYGTGTWELYLFNPDYRLSCETEV
jgi:hypothetical protein